jgi:hypothetical protein
LTTGLRLAYRDGGCDSRPGGKEFDMMTRLVLLMVMALFMPASALAEDVSSRQFERLGTRMGLVFACARQVRESNAGSDFNAYISVAGDVRTLGADDDEEAEFRACLERRGFFSKEPRKDD